MAHDFRTPSSAMQPPSAALSPGLGGIENSTRLEQLQSGTMPEAGISGPIAQGYGNGAGNGGNRPPPRPPTRPPPTRRTAEAAMPGSGDLMA